MDYSTHEHIYANFGQFGINFVINETNYSDMNETCQDPARSSNFG
jgi:hypothetical protein